VNTKKLDRIRKALAKAGHAKFAERVLALARPGVSIATRRAPGAKLSPGTSRIGGAPDLPPGSEWPTWNRRPLAFLAQINLADVAGFPCCEVLPAEGLLQFFYDREQETWGFDPKDRGSWRVLLQTEIGKPAKAPGAEPYASCRLSFREVTTPVTTDSFDYEQLEPSEEEQEAYDEALEALEDDSGSDNLHQLLGNASPIQNDMQLECQLASNGVACGEPEAYESRAAKKLTPGASDWRLLFQLDSDDAAEMMWGDVGCLYFWITEKALKARRFDECWMVLQCG
jgi:uncharacterized protein YwqG